MTTASLHTGRPWPSWLAGLLLLVATAVLAVDEPDPGGAGGAVATGSGPLETAIVVEVFEPASPAGDRPARFVPARQVAAGDEVHYTIRVRNPGKQAVTDVQVTKRLPFGMHYIPGSAVGPACDVEFSADGGATFAARPEASEFTHVRWNLRRPLAAGATALLRFRATFR